VIVINAKTQRPGVCNAAEKLLVHRSIAEKALPELAKKLREVGVEIRGCERTSQIIECKKAKDADWYKEYLDLIIAVKIVDSIDDAIAHINKYGSRHSEAIISKNQENIDCFFDLVDAAVVYSNASTRFTDGNEFGLGTEIGISTQKLHARGPMGLKAMTTTKYLVTGNGQVR
jgi:glutamate-5-semialdehyde dehydrogenase